MFDRGCATLALRNGSGWFDDFPRKDYADSKKIGVRMGSVRLSVARENTENEGGMSKLKRLSLPHFFHTIITIHSSYFSSISLDSTSHRSIMHTSIPWVPARSSRNTLLVSNNTSRACHAFMTSHS